MIVYFKNIFFIGLIYLSVSSAADEDIYITKAPPYLTSCEIYKPEFTKCSTNSIQKLFIEFAKGIPGLKVGKPIDPFFIKKLVYKQDNNQVATITANLTNLVTKGFAKTIVKESKVSKKDFSWETTLLVPKLRIDGHYKMEGKILVVPLQGNGEMFIECDDLTIKMHTKTRLYEKGGFTFYNVTGVRIDISISKLKTRFDNLFNGNKEIEDSTNEFFNENWRDLFEALRPVLIQTIEGVLLGQLQAYFHYVPANFFVSDIPTSKELYGKS
ncbi:protein takeout-like [Eupeodes corollae]|uniref:protein takeout-like n=1 Tax=Eupeodes corollae TaxID=290404 RepID=UPI002493BD1F|nr:protein takeout-like [Eupeodes corollae]